MKYPQWNEKTSDEKFSIVMKEIHLETNNATTKDDLTNMLKFSFEKCDKCKTIRNLYAEIDRLTALVPKVVVPKKQGMSDLYFCECCKPVGYMRETIGETWLHRYCSACGSRMDWDKVEVEK